MDLFEKIMEEKKNVFVIILLLTIISCLTLFIMNGVPIGHDLNFHFARIQSICDNLKIGKLSSIYPNYLNGYGYANNLFYPDIFLYIPSLLMMLNIPLVVAYKIFLFLISFFSILTMYFTVSRITNNKKAAIISSVIYAFSSYRFVDTYTRAALGESLAFIFAPLIIYGIYEIIYGDYKKFYYLVIGMSGLILSHLLSSYMIIIALIILCSINIKRLFKEKKRLFYIIVSAIITVLLTSFFVLPMFEQMQEISFVVNNINSFLNDRTMPLLTTIIEYPYYFKIEPWIPFGVGITFLISCIYFFKNYKLSNDFTKVCYILGIFFLIATTKIIPWNFLNNINIFAVIQFPWRFLYLSTLFLTIGTGLLISYVNLPKKKVLWIVGTAFIPIVTILFCNINSGRVNELRYYEISFGEYLNEKASQQYILSKGNSISSTHDIDIDYKKENLKITINFKNNHSNNTLELPLLYYKGYQVLVNGEKVKPNISVNGLVEFTINKYTQEGTAIIEYKNTKLKSITYIASATTLIGFTVLVIKLKRKEDKYEKKQ